MNISLSILPNGAFFVCADDEREERVCTTLSEAEYVLQALGIAMEERVIASGLLESGTHTTVWFDERGQTVIDDSYGEIT